MNKKVCKADFAELYEKFAPMVLRRCRSILKDEEKALDAMQDVFVRIIESQCKIKELCSSLFYVTATRVCLNKIRSEKLRSGPDFEKISETLSDNEAGEREKEKIEASMVLEKIFESRDKKDYLIATLHFADGLTYDETAELVNMSVSGVRKRLRLLLEYAQKLLQEEKL